MSAPLVAGVVCARPECGHGEDLHDGICFGTACECVRFVGSAGVLPVPVGPEPQASERDRLRAALVVALENAHQTHPCPEYGNPYWTGCVHYDEAGRVSGVGSCHNGRRADAVLAVRDAEVERLRARIAELEAERHSTNAALDDAVQELRAVKTPDGKWSPALPWARLMDDEDLQEFLGDLLDSLNSSPATTRAVLDEVEKTCSTWRLVAEAQHGHNTAPGPDAARQSFGERAARESDPGRRVAYRMLAEPGGEFDAYLRHPYRTGHDLPEAGGV